MTKKLWRTLEDFIEEPETTVNVEAAVIAEERRFMCVKRIRRGANSHVTSVKFTCREVIVQILWERLRSDPRGDYSRN